MVSIQGRIIAEGKPLKFASINITGTPYDTYTNTNGNYRIENIPTEP